jgi:hypothetical protein
MGVTASQAGSLRCCSWFRVISCFFLVLFKEFCYAHEI